MCMINFTRPDSRTDLFVGKISILPNEFDHFMEKFKIIKEGNEVQAWTFEKFMDDGILIEMCFIMKNGESEIVGKVNDYRITLN